MCPRQKSLMRVTNGDPCVRVPVSGWPRGEQSRQLCVPSDLKATVFIKLSPVHLVKPEIPPQKLLSSNVEGFFIPNIPVKGPVQQGRSRQPWLNIECDRLFAISKIKTWPYEINVYEPARGIRERTRRTSEVIVMYLMDCLCVNYREKGKGYTAIYKVIQGGYWQLGLHCSSYFTFESVLDEISWKLPSMLLLPGTFWLTRQLVQLQSKGCRRCIWASRRWLKELTITASVSECS